MTNQESSKALICTPQSKFLQASTPAEPQETVETISGVRVEKKYLANWEKWSRVPVVSLLEAVHLSFGVKPSSNYVGCAPTSPLSDRLDLALANIGVGGSLETVADPFAPFSSMLRVQHNTVRVRLATFGDWVLDTGMQLDEVCPRSIPGLSAAPHLAFERQQKTLLKIIGMLARAVAHKRQSAVRNDKIIVNAVVSEALEASETPNGPLGVKKSTLAEYIRKGLNLLEEKY